MPEDAYLIMLKAILNGKAGRISIGGDRDQSWHELFRLREDLLTAAFFGRIRYLSLTGERNVLSLLTPDNLKPHPGAIEDVLFWPKLNGVLGRSFVEPDVLIRCENALVLIEVKPPFGGRQSAEQWENEIEGLVRQTDKDTGEWDVPENIHFVALGNNASDWRNVATQLEAQYVDYGLVVHAMEWAAISHGIAELLDVEDGRDRAVYSDWLDAFALFGLVERPLPFSDLLPFREKISTNWRRQFIDLPLAIVKPSVAKDRDWASLLQLTNTSKLKIELWA